MSNSLFIQKEKIPTQKEEEMRSPITEQMKPSRTRTPPGKSPLALTIKAILRPPLKAIYYTQHWGRAHKVLVCTLLTLLRSVVS